MMLCKTVMLWTSKMIMMMLRMMRVRAVNACNSAVAKTRTWFQSLHASPQREKCRGPRPGELVSAMHRTYAKIYIDSAADQNCGADLKCGAYLTCGADLVGACGSEMRLDMPQEALTSEIPKNSWQTLIKRTANIPQCGHTVGRKESCSKSRYGVTLPINV